MGAVLGTGTTRSTAQGYIAIEGPIGVGKTSLARRIAHSFGGALVLEEPEQNPFLERFYRAPRQFALATQLSFLFERARKLAELRQADMFAPLRVADFLLDKDPLFARLNLDDDEFRLYQRIYNELELEVAAPRLVVYLQAPVDILLQRIRRRGVAAEQHIDPGYLAGVVEAYARLFLNYAASPLLIVNAAQINLVDEGADYAELIEYIERMPPGRHFFNPLSQSASPAR